MLERPLQTHAPAAEESAAIDLPLPDSAALRRLIEEVRNVDPAVATTAYNRTYHRHNR